MDTPNTTTNTNLVPLWFGLVFFIAALAIGLYEFQQYLSDRTTRDLDDQTLSDLRVAATSGNFDQALRQYEAIKVAPELTADTKARAARDVAGLAFRQTGDVSAVLASIEELKKGVADPQVSPSVRANNISAIAQAYMQSGENPAVLDAIFSTQPYASYRVATSTSASLRNLFEWSGAVYPNARAAIGEASFLMMEVLNMPRESVPEADIMTVQDLLKSAESLAQGELVNDKTFKRSRRYAGFLFWRAFVYGGLAYEGVDEYKQSYAKQYTDYIEFLAANGSATSLPYLSIARWHYAVFLMRVDGNTTDAASQAALVAQEVNATQNRDFLSLIAQKKALAVIENDFLGSSFAQLAKLSPEFENLIASH